MKIIVNSQFNIGDIVKYNKRRYKIVNIILSGEYNCACCNYIIVNKTSVRYVYESEIGLWRN